MMMAMTMTMTVMMQEKVGVRDNCLDIWSYLHYNRAVFTNPFYMDPSAEDTPTTFVLLPPLPQLLRNVMLWSDYFCRWSAVPMTSVPPESTLEMLQTEDGQ